MTAVAARTVIYGSASGVYNGCGGKENKDGAHGEAYTCKQIQTVAEKTEFSWYICMCQSMCAVSLDSK